MPPPQGLRHQVNTFFLVRGDVDRIEEVMPAYSGQILVFLEGEAAMHFDHGTQSASDRVILNAPLLQATPFTVNGPISCFGASLTHRGWAELVQRPVDEWHSRILAPGELFGRETAELFTDLAEMSVDDVEGLAEALGSAIHKAAVGLGPSHVRFISETLAWLSSGFSPPVEELFERLAVSRRQTQRLCNRFFGVPPKQLLKRVRAVRAATLLSQPNLPDATRDELLLAYFDQSHLINDIKRYTGRTPTLLEEGEFVTQTLKPEGHGPPGRYLRGATE